MINTPLLRSGYTFVSSIELSSYHAQQRALLAITRLSFKIIFIASLTYSAAMFTSLAATISIPLCVLGNRSIQKIINLYFKIIFKRSAGMVFQNSDELETYSSTLQQPGPCKLIPTNHGAETALWRKRLIAAAEHNIVISGNYCGGKAFLSLLSDIELRMQEKPNLKVVIITSNKFLKRKERTKLDVLRKHPNFSLIESPDCWDSNQGITASTNHSKAFVIDYGRYFIQGGSSIKCNFVSEGVDSSDQELAHQDPFQTPKTKAEDHFLDKLLMPNGFRDQDFIGESEVGLRTVGTEMYRQLLLLGYQWEEYSNRCQGSLGYPVKASELGLLTGERTYGQQNEPLCLQLLREPLPMLDTPFTTIETFSSDNRAADTTLEVLSQGPHLTMSPFGERILREIHNAKEEIHINHMYFHPNTSIFNALIEAANRGVRITIISNDLHEQAPHSHKGFVHRNRYNYYQLIHSVKPEVRGNISIYEFSQNKKGNHKKVIVIDDLVIAGSSNLGLKSIEWSADNELNFVARSAKLKQSILAIFQQDIARSRKIDHASLSISLRIYAAAQRCMAFLID